jgi:hypothetical protein
MSKRLWNCALLVALALSIWAAASIRVQAEEDQQLYTGRHVAVCKPAPIAGCVCETDSLGHISVFAHLVGGPSGRVDQSADPELLRMIDWMRRICMTAIPSTTSR